MPVPVLTAEEIAQLKKDAAKQTSFAEALAAAQPAKAAAAAELAISDGAFKKYFDYYNDDIIGKYDAEKKAISGVYQAAPITEADVLGPATIDGSVRTTPTLPVTDIIRVPEFDGGNTTTTLANEQQAIADQAPIEDHLINGYTPQPTVNVGTVTSTNVTGASTTVSVTDPATPITFTVGDYFIVESLTDSALLKVTSATPGGGGPPYTYTLGIQVVIPPAGTLTAGAACIVFSGFTNADRTAKVTTDPALQNIMDYLIAALQTQINLRITRLNEELAALGGNLDPDGVAQIATAVTAANTSKTFLTNYLITTDISDTGLASLATERGVRSAFLTTRLGQINANYTGQTKNYYNERYNFANNRGNTSRGTLRRQKATEASAATLTTYAADAAAAAATLLSIIP